MRIVANRGVVGVMGFGSPVGVIEVCRSVSSDRLKILYEGA